MTRIQSEVRIMAQVTSLTRIFISMKYHHWDAEMMSALGYGGWPGWRLYDDT